MKKVIVTIVIIVALVVAAAIIIPITQLNATVEVPETVVEIPENATTAQIGDILVENNMVKSAFVYKLYMRLHSDQASKLKAGIYTFEGRYSVGNVVSDLVIGGAPMGLKLTIPEGYTLAQIGEKVAETGVVTAEDFLSACQNGDYPYDYLPGKDVSDRLQGYLYPETYFIDQGATGEAIVGQMLAEFDKQLTEEWRSQLESRGLSMYDWITMASIIEREAVVSEDRPVISGVFYNRLGQNMKLQSCATVQYALGEVKPVLTYEDIAIDSPYNTYIHEGLPPGPICSPGHESLAASLYPAETDYIYFVAKKDGSHVFSVTYEEHMQAKNAIDRGEM